MLINRVIRNRIGDVAIVEEMKRWNESPIDSLADYGVGFDETEEQVQQDWFELMAMEERLTS